MPGRRPEIGAAPRNCRRRAFRPSLPLRVLDRKAAESVEPRARRPAATSFNQRWGGVSRAKGLRGCCPLSFLRRLPAGSARVGVVARPPPLSAPMPENRRVVERPCPPVRTFRPQRRRLARSSGATAPRRIQRREKISLAPTKAFPGRGGSQSAVSPGREVVARLTEGRGPLGHPPPARRRHGCISRHPGPGGTGPRAPGNTTCSGPTSLHRERRAAERAALAEARNAGPQVTVDGERRPSTSAPC